MPQSASQCAPNSAGADQRSAPSSAGSAPLPKPKWRPGAVTLFLGFVLVIGLACWAGYAVWKQGLQNQLDAEIAKIRERGEPVWFAEIRPEPVPEAENGRAEFVRAHQVLWEDNDAARAGRMPATWTYNLAEKSYGDFAQLTPKQAAEIRAMLAESPRPLLLLSKALEKPRIQLDYDYDTPHPLFTLLNEVHSARYLVQRLQGKSAIARIDGDLDLAAECTGDQLRLVSALRTEVFGVSQIVRFASTSKSLESLQHLLATGPMSDDRFRELDQLLAELEPTLQIRDAVLTERAMYLTEAAEATRDSISEATNNESPLTSWVYVNFEALRIKDQLAMLEAFSEAIDIADDPSDEARARLHASFANRTETSDWELLFAKISLPSALYRTSLAQRQHCINARIAMRIARAYHQTGRMPATLQEVTDEALPEIAPGLVSGLPLSYEVTSDESGVGFRLVDLGADGLEVNGAPSASESIRIISVQFGKPTLIPETSKVQ